MNSVEKKLNGYITKAESFSGFDDYSYEGEMSGFDDFDENQLYMDDMSNASGSGVRVSEPFIVLYTNTTTADVTAYIFGYNDYFGSSNYGNPAAVVITNVQGGTYGRLIAQSNNAGFKIGKWRFQCTTSSQLQVTLSVNYVNANGNVLTKPFNLSVMRDAYQQQSDILDTSKVVSVDGNTYISFTLKGSAALTISMYPVISISSKAALNGATTLQAAKAPRLSGKNAAPVIIQTTQAVKGING